MIIDLFLQALDDPAALRDDDLHAGGRTSLEAQGVPRRNIPDRESAVDVTHRNGSRACQSYKSRG